MNTEEKLYAYQRTQPVRIDKEVVAELRRIAQADGRTMSGLIEVILRKALKMEGRQQNAESARS